MTENKDARAVIELTGKIARLEKLMAIQEKQIRLSNERGDYWKGECMRLMRRDCGLTDETTSLKVGGTRDEGGINLTHKEDI